MKLFKTTSRRTYRKPRQRAGWSTTVTAKTRLKRWAKRRTKKLWRTAKRRATRRAKRLWRKTKWAKRNQQIARTARQFQRHHANVRGVGGYQVDASGGVSYQPSTTGQVGGGQAKLPPPDGTMANCQRCSYEIQYNGNRRRWEHTGKGHADCFQRRRG